VHIKPPLPGDSPTSTHLSSVDSLSQPPTSQMTFFNVLGQALDIIKPLLKAPLPKGSPHTLVDLLTPYTPIQDSVLSYLEIRDVLALSRTMRALRDSYKIVERAEFNINNDLKWFFDSPTVFRSLQVEHDVLICGPFVYSFMARHLTAPLATSLHELCDIVVEDGDHAVALAQFLSSQGYKDDGDPLIESTHRVSNFCVANYSSLLTQFARGEPPSATHPPALSYK
jgi:hypothetical protein